MLLHNTSLLKLSTVFTTKKDSFSLTDAHYWHMGIQHLGRNLVYKIEGISMDKEEERESEDHVSDMPKLRHLTNLNRPRPPCFSRRNNSGSCLLRHFASSFL